jgi:hypothetical protein
LPVDGPIDRPIGDAAAHTLTNCAPTPSDRLTVNTEIKARTSGELFLYVNDAVLMLPTGADFFYRNNRGEARISVERVTSR